MQDLDRLIVRFRQFGGMRLVWEYAKMGVLWVGVKEVIRCAIKGRSFKCVYPVVTKRVDEILITLYGNGNDNGNGNFEPGQKPAGKTERESRKHDKREFLCNEICGTAECHLW